MSVEDKRIGRQLEREINRFQSLDLGDIRIQVFNGNAYVGGIIRPAIGQYSLNIKEELRVFTETSMKVPGIRSVTIDARVETSPKK